MKKIIGYGLFFCMVCFFALMTAGCPNPNTDDDRKTGDPVSLVNTVFAGEDANHKWVTIAFYDETSVYYFPDPDGYADGYPDAGGATGKAPALNWQYTCDEAGVSGEIIKRETNPPYAGEAPGAFTISADGRTLGFASYAGGVAQEFKRVRNSKAVDDPVPFTFEPLSAGSSLDGTVWAATAYRTRDWTTLTVTSTGAITAGTIQVSHSFDCTSFPRAYTNYVYNTNSTLAYIGAFKISGSTFTFLNFYGHGGEVTLRRMR